MDPIEYLPALGLIGYGLVILAASIWSEIGERQRRSLVPTPAPLPLPLPPRPPLPFPAPQPDPLPAAVRAVAMAFGAARDEPAPRASEPAPAELAAIASERYCPACQCIADEQMPESCPFPPAGEPWLCAHHVRALRLCGLGPNDMARALVGIHGYGRPHYYGGEEVA